MNPQEYAKDLKKVIRWSFVLILMLTFFLAVLSVNALKEYDSIGKGVFPTKTLSVNGEGEVFVTPDVAQFTFTAKEEGDSVASAQEEVNKKINTALDSLKNIGVEEKDIKTTGYNAYPRYVYPEIRCLEFNCQPQERILSGYEVSQTITVKVRDTEKAGEALTQVANSKVSDISGLQFVIDDKDVFIAEARNKAIANAEEKIQQLAESLDVRIKGVVNFSESFGGDQRPMYAEASFNSKGIGGDLSSSAQIPIGENALKVQVYITYEIK